MLHCITNMLQENPTEKLTNKKNGVHMSPYKNSATYYMACLHKQTVRLLIYKMTIALIRGAPVFDDIGWRINFKVI